MVLENVSLERSEEGWEFTNQRFVNDHYVCLDWVTQGDCHAYNKATYIADQENALIAYETMSEKG